MFLGGLHLLSQDPMRHGAKVYLCKGQDGREEFGANAHWGNMHMKAVVLDGRVAYTGSANFTRRKW